MFGSSAALKAVQLENAQLRKSVDELRELIDRLTQRFEEDLPSIVEDKVEEGIRNLDLTDEIESAVSDIMRNATVSIDF